MIRPFLAALLLAFAVAVPAQEETLRVGINSADIGTLDPHRTSSTHEKVPISWIFGGLVRFPPARPIR